MEKFGIDISYWQGDFDMTRAKNEGVEFVIARAGYRSTKYGDLHKDEQFENNYRKAKKLGLPVGSYFYSVAKNEAQAIEEADYFAKLLDGKQLELPVYFDIEENQVFNLGKSEVTKIVHAFCQRMEKLGFWVGIYSSLNAFNNFMNDDELTRYAHWIAQWNTACTYQRDYGMWQFGGTTNKLRSNKIAGQTIDQDYLYVDYPNKIKAAGKNGFNKQEEEKESKMTYIDCADVAATIHADMCTDERNGYSWSPRNGGDHPDGTKHLTIGGLDYSYPLGSYDCSSSVCKAWQEAIKYTAYAGALDGATYTGNMRSVFENSGLFYSSYDDAKRGDVYLNDNSHTAMCQDGNTSQHGDGKYGYDALSEASINEFGECFGGRVGDQTGNELHIRGFYSYPWNATLHYNGDADGNTDADPTPAPSPSGSIDELARRVLNGEFGNGDERRAALGDKYDEVQRRVNEILNGGAGEPGFDVEKAAQDVIAGKYGNGDARRAALGSHYDEVQKRVNEILGASPSYDIDELAYAVIRGEYGNGDARRAKLGDKYDAVQRRVNELLS